MSTLERAIAIAAEGHAGQTDKGGAPYILHPLRMMMSLSTLEERIVAVLHDVVEDCPEWTFERLQGEGFWVEILVALDSVTERDGEDYEDFVLRAAANPIGCRVKLADMTHRAEETYQSLGKKKKKKRRKRKPRLVVNLPTVETGGTGVSTKQQRIWNIFRAHKSSKRRLPKRQNGGDRYTRQG